MLRTLIRQTLLTEDSTDEVPEHDAVASWTDSEGKLATEEVAPTYLEREIKFAVSGLEDIERRLKELEGTRARFVGVTHERNCVLDTDGDELKARDERLRLREIEGQPGVVVTWKGPASEQNGVRRREEREFHADDRTACLAVFRNLGFRPVQPYEKVRSTWRLDGAIVCLDTLPFGCFVELELTPEVDESSESGVVESLVADLGLEEAQRIQASYARLQQDWQDLLEKYARKAEKTSR